MVRPLVALKTLSRFLAKSPATSVLELVLVVILAAKSPFRSAKESPYIGGINLLLLAKDIARLYIKVANPLRSTALECIALVAHRVGKEKLQEVNQGFQSLLVKPHQEENVKLTVQAVGS